MSAEAGCCLALLRRYKFLRKCEARSSPTQSTQRAFGWYNLALRPSEPTAAPVYGVFAQHAATEARSNELVVTPPASTVRAELFFLPESRKTSPLGDSVQRLLGAFLTVLAVGPAHVQCAKCPGTGVAAISKGLPSACADLHACPRSAGETASSAGGARHDA